MIPTFKAFRKQDLAVMRNGSIYYIVTKNGGASIRPGKAIGATITLEKPNGDETVMKKGDFNRKVLARVTDEILQVQLEKMNSQERLRRFSNNVSLRNSLADINKELYEGETA